MQLEQLRKEWESIAFKFEEPCKEFRKLEKEAYNTGWRGRSFYFCDK